MSGTWRCAVCEAVNHGGRTCSACGAALTRRSTVATAARARLAPSPPPPPPAPAPLPAPVRRAITATRCRKKNGKSGTSTRPVPSTCCRYPVAACSTSVRAEAFGRHHKHPWRRVWHQDAPGYGYRAGRRDWVPGGPSLTPTGCDGTSPRSRCPLGTFSSTGRRHPSASGRPSSPSPSGIWCTPCIPGSQYPGSRDWDPGSQRSGAVPICTRRCLPSASPFLPAFTLQPVFLRSSRRNKPDHCAG